MTRRIPLMLACCLLTACAAGPQQTLVQQAPQIPQTQVPPPANLLRPPPILPRPQSGAMRHLESDHMTVAESFHQVVAQLCGLLKHMEIEHRECLPYLRADPATQP